MADQNKRSFFTSPIFLVVTLFLGIGAGVFATMLLLNVFERKVEAQATFVPLVTVTEDDTDPAKWGQNWPRQYESYKKTAVSTRTRFGGHGGSEALPAQKIERDPWLRRMFLGYAFAIDYRDRRGHAYMLTDQEETERQSKPQSGSCLHCHASVMPLYRQLGDGDAMKGFTGTHAIPYAELNKMLHETGEAHPVSCVDCHEPNTMGLRVTRPGFIKGIQALAESDAEVPHLPSILAWRESNRKTAYDPNTMASRTEMRSFSCGQCHVEYYCSSDFPLTFPWGNGMSVEQQERFWDETKLSSGERFYDYKHKETGAEILKAQHPEFELWSQGIHARSGVSCADCHMPYMRDGALKVSDHWVRSPLLNISRACQSCHHFSEKEIQARVDVIQDRNHRLLQNGGKAIIALIDAIVAAKEAGANDAQLHAAREFQRKAQWRLDFIAAENSMGFHAPQEAARILGEASDLARQGVVAAMNWEKQPQAASKARPH
ncbi:ammonia-forming cytochrome c nitrite reductase subunit c552 [Acanthopleuribacter pedis]|uniref:nitrite reductase (cytochrome; ammonia-forming) n=1 Tax=Acanthopleuribacter pedis TaxID=442870 RepID=A0A8J7U766_9BACT|nr:ammonia-forming cytochrome c nitrite reductase subunit c552 [Acanthopleuribacter pedis]MBO1322679.1 ammonia-forming cytochrome c nitrite reductase subunit c552 [Acanthopleuribacter pedis]